MESGVLKRNYKKYKHKLKKNARKAKDKVNNFKAPFGTQTLWTFIKGFLTFAYNLVTDTSQLLNAMVIIGIVLLVMFIINMLRKHAYPRPVQLCHDENPFNESMTGMFERLTKEFIPKSGVGGNIGTADDWEFYYMFAEYIFYVNHSQKDSRLPKIKYTDLWGNEQTAFPISSNYSFSFFTMWDANYIPKQAPLSIKTIICNADGSVDVHKFNNYIIAKVLPMTKFRVAIAEAAAKVNKNPTGVASIPLLQANLILNVYCDRLIFDFNIRRPPGIFMQMTMIKIYLSEFAHYCFITQIKETIWPKYAKFVTWFAKETKMLFDAVTDGLKMCLSNLETGNVMRYEGIDGLFKVFFPFFSILPMTFNLLKTFFEKIEQFFTDPVGFIIWLLMVILILILIVLWEVFGGIFVFVLLDPTAMLLALAFCVALTIVWTVAFLVVFLIFLLIVVIDILTNGQIRVILRCENKPDSWMTQSGFNYENEFEQMFLCWRPCFKGYKPRGLLCQAIAPGEPPYCPQQYIYSACMQKDNVYKKPDGKRDPVYPTLPHKMPYIAPYEYKYSPPAKYYTLSRAEQMAMIHKQFPNVTNYFSTCHDKFKAFDGIPLAMCENLDSFLDPASKTHPHDYINIKKLCKQMYCDFGQRSASFCNSTTVPDISAADEQMAIDLPKTKIQSKIVVAAMATIVLLIIVAALYYKLGGFQWTQLP